jgi:hypothetical protein
MVCCVQYRRLLQLIPSDETQRQCFGKGQDNLFPKPYPPTILHHLPCDYTLNKHYNYKNINYAFSFSGLISNDAINELEWMWKEVVLA